MGRWTLKPGDTVKHLPTNEKWIIASMSEDGALLCPGGWPETIAKTSDCELVESCTDEDHVLMLRAAAQSNGVRANWAKRALHNRNDASLPSSP